MSTSDRSQEQARLAAEFERLDLTHSVLSDIVHAVADVSKAKGYRDNEFEMSRNELAAVSSAEVHAERIAVFDRLLDFRHSAESAAKIRAAIAVPDRERRDRSRGIGRSR